MIQTTDIEKLKKARQLVDEVSSHVDCQYCKSHMIVISDMIEDVADISRLNLLYGDDPAGLDRLRDMIQSENMLRVMAMGSKLIGIARRIRRYIVNR